MENLSRVLGMNEESIVVRNISGRLKNHNSLNLTWSDETLSQQYCPEDEVKDIFNKLTDNVTGEVSDIVDEEFNPPINVDEAFYMLDGRCQPIPINLDFSNSDGKDGKFQLLNSKRNITSKSNDKIYAA